MGRRRSSAPAPFAALVRYNVLFLFAWSLCFVGAYFLARELGLGQLGGAAAGVAFAYAPYRVTEAGHLHVISSGGIALALFLLLRGYRRSSAKLVLIGWLVAAWQVSLGFTLGLQFTYLLALLALLILFYWWRGRLRPNAGVAPAELDEGQQPQASGGRGPLVARHLLVVTAIGIVLCGLIAVYQARPYLQISHDYPTARRTLKEVENYSSGPAALLSASSENRVWGSATSSVRETRALQERGRVLPRRADPRVRADRVFVAARSPFTRRMRIALALGAVVCSVFAHGARADRLRVAVSVALRLRAGMGRRARPWADLHARDALLRAARRRRRAAARLGWIAPAGPSATGARARHRASAPCC